jgi:hypothetical protein
MMIGELKGLTMNRDGSQNVTITIKGDFRAGFDALRGKPLDIEVKEHKPRRSLDANAYAWVLIDKIAEKTHIKKSEVYRQAIREIGGVSTTICLQNKAVEWFCQCWAMKGSGWQTETEPSTLEGCTRVIAYYGSSVYDTKQMSALIDSLIQDAEALGIETITPQEKARLLAQYGRKHE